MKRCAWCHGRFREEIICLDEGFKHICEYCLDELRTGLRKEKDCIVCLKEKINGQCMTKGCPK